MNETTLTADYVIASAAGLAFADTLLSESPASMIIVDRRVVERSVRASGGSPAAAAHRHHGGTADVPLRDRQRGRAGATARIHRPPRSHGLTTDQGSGKIDLTPTKDPERAMAHAFPHIRPAIVDAADRAAGIRCNSEAHS